MKYDWKKQDKKRYLAANEPELIMIPEFKYFMISGKGNPNDEAFSEAISVLYSLSYAVKMMPKKGIVPEGYFDYVIFPLEALWKLSEKAKEFDKNQLIYTIMMRQPDFVTDEIAKQALEIVKKKKKNTLLDDVAFGVIADKMCVQMLHLGSYDNESSSFELMQEYCLKNNLERENDMHREIYISDARKTRTDKLKTVLRFSVKTSK